MFLLVGLGNPGSEYSKTKHNFGFWIIDKYVDKSSLTFKAGKGDYLLAKNNNILFVKPTSFMNNSGVPILEIKHYFKVETKNILVVYDDIDLPLGMVKFKEKGSAGGHKGIESIIYQLKTDQFHRLRVGIATNENMRPAEKYVLSKFKNIYLQNVEETIEKACDAIDYYSSHDIKETMNRFNEKIGKS